MTLPTIRIDPTQLQHSFLVTLEISFFICSKIPLHSFHSFLTLYLLPMETPQLFSASYDPVPFVSG